MRNVRGGGLLGIRTLHLPAQDMPRQPLPVVEARDGMEPHERHRNLMRRHKREPPRFRRRLTARERKRHKVLPASLRVADIANGLPSVRGLRLEKNVRIGIVAPIMVQLARRRQLKGANRHRLRKMDDAHVTVRLDRCGRDAIHGVRTGRSKLRPSPVSFWRRERNVTDIVPVTVRIAEPRRNRNGRDALLRVRIGRRGNITRTK